MIGFACILNHSFFFFSLNELETLKCYKIKSVKKRIGKEEGREENRKSDVEIKGD